MILLENDPRSVGLTVATVILLGVGLIPLIVATIGLLRIMYGSSHPQCLLPSVKTDLLIWLQIGHRFRRQAFITPCGNPLTRSLLRRGRLARRRWILFGRLQITKLGSYGEEARQSRLPRRWHHSRCPDCFPSLPLEKQDQTHNYQCNCKENASDSDPGPVNNADTPYRSLKEPPLPSPSSSSASPTHSSQSSIPTLLTRNGTTSMAPSPLLSSWRSSWNTSS